MPMFSKLTKLFHPIESALGERSASAPEPLDRWQDYLEESRAYSLYLAGKDPRVPTLSFAQFIDRLDAARLEAARRNGQRHQEAG